ncbi:MAG TPA: IgGFc-binding protein [Kofleriaceae bacterium]|nr:IgGFc-binding protein [Kofleriaceae bacterium]
MKGLLCVALALALAACGNPSRGNDNGGHPDSMSDCTMDGAHRCLGASYQTCTGGLWMNAIDCPVACSDALGCVECTPGLPFCKDGNVWSCNDDGTPGSELQACGGVTTCVGGGCVDACVDAAANKSYIGCEYWAADLDNAVEVWGGSGGTCTQGAPMTLNVCFTMMGGGIYAGQCDPQDDGTAPHTCPAGTTCQPKLVCASDAQHGPFAVVVSNPQAKDATVTVTGPGGQTITKVIAAGQVAPILMQANNAIPDQSIDGTGKFKKAYKIVSDLPVVAYQFNPLDNSNVFSNDASLLIPRTTFDTDYYALSWPTLDRRPSRDPYYGYLTILAWQDNTQVAVTPTATVKASQTQTTIAAGSTANFTLNAFEVLQLEAAPGANADLTGTLITSPNMKSFGVFGGHEATAFGGGTAPDMQHPNGPGFADHLEEMIFPGSTWGQKFAITRSKKRTTEPDLLRIMAEKPNTTVTFNPPPALGTCGTLGPGQFCDVQIQVDTAIDADQPVLVGHFLESSTWWNNGQTSYVGTGDPSMAIAAPTEQYRKEYAILVPAQYTENYISISAPATGGVNVDGQAVMLTTYTGGSTYRGARLLVAAGQHKITCADGCGITVYGYSSGVSYMFAGGLDLKPIVIF